MSPAPLLTRNNPLTVRLGGDARTSKFPMCITFHPQPGVPFSPAPGTGTEFRHSPKFNAGACVLHPRETLQAFAARVESVSGGAYVILTIDLSGKVDIIEVVISGEHPYVAQSKYNYGLLSGLARESVEEALRVGALVIKRNQ
jgi:hypothetical protein